MSQGWSLASVARECAQPALRGSSTLSATPNAASVVMNQNARWKSAAPAVPACVPRSASATESASAPTAIPIPAFICCSVEVLHEERCGHKECDGGAAIESVQHQACSWT